MPSVYLEAFQDPMSLPVHPGLMASPVSSPDRALPCSLTLVTGLIVHDLYLSPCGDTKYRGNSFAHVLEPRMILITKHRAGI